MLRLFPKWACGLKLKKERGKNPDVKPQQCYLQYSLLTTEWTSWAFLIISAQWLSANCSSKPCRVLLICYLTLNTFHWIKSLQRDANSKSLKSGVIRFSPYYIKIISYSKSSIHSRREEWTHSVVTGTLLCSTKDWPCSGLLPSLLFQTCYNNIYTEKIRALSLLSNSESKPPELYHRAWESN